LKWGKYSKIQETAVLEIFDKSFCSKHKTVLPYSLGLFENNYINLDIYLLTAIGLTPGGSNTVHIYTQTIHRTTQYTEQNIHDNKNT